MTWLPFSNRDFQINDIFSKMYNLFLNVFMPILPNLHVANCTSCIMKFNITRTLFLPHLLKSNPDSIPHTYEEHTFSLLLPIILPPFSSTNLNAGSRQFLFLGQIPQYKPQYVLEMKTTKFNRSNYLDINWNISSS